MKLLRAEFQNFRMLRDLELNFATTQDKHLTVVRAENESGKTTILHGLQWALYGDAALPGKGVGFRLHPIDWDTNDGSRVPISATVEFEVSSHRQAAGTLRETRRRYRLVRSTFEEVDRDASRFESTVKLFALDETGARPIEAPDALISEVLPPELREVFFTDGDRALSFIEADVAITTKRDRVERAIQSLLGLGVIQDALRHVQKSAAEANKKARQVGTSSELTRVASRLETLDVDKEKTEAELDDAKLQFGTFDEKVQEIDHKISAALQKGDRDKLRNDIEDAKVNIKRLDSQLAAANKDHATLFRNQSLAIDVLGPVVGRAFTKLDELHDQGKIPNTTVPVLEDRLATEVCICGETLKAGESGADIRRAHIQHLIDDSRHADEIQKLVTELYYGAQQLKGDSAESKWLGDYARVVKLRDGLAALREDAGRKFKALEMKLDALPDTDIQGLRETRRTYNEQRDRQLSRKARLETQLDSLKREHEKLEAERDRLLREEKKGALVRAELEVTQDVSQVLRSAYEHIKHEELKKVSELMNGIFLGMIGADPEQGAIIQRAELSADYDIIVHGPSGRTLNPDRDLNGASRRALTLAFILALTKVSEVEAPNVIDTPLGMTSGYVKRSILRTAIRESTQLILFLTRAEIAGCEDIIDEAAGMIFTLTNPAHYPTMLVNDPGVRERKVLRCECNHRNECNLCQRRDDLPIELQAVA